MAAGFGYTRREMGAALLLLLAAGPVDARFLVSVAGVPSASLRVSAGGGRYRYQAVHLLEEGAERFERSFDLVDGRVEGLTPEVLALLAPPAPGCRAVLEERRGAPEALCVTARRGDLVEGTLDGVAFRARYRAGRLERVEVGPVRFERVEGAPALPPGVESPFARGFEVAPGPGAPALRPALPGVERVAPATGPAAAPRQRCLQVARAAIAADPALALVLGLVVEDGRAYPHAWVRRGTQHLDPTLGPREAPALAGRTYLRLPEGSAGRVYLDLLDGRRQVTGGP